MSRPQPSLDLSGHLIDPAPAFGMEEAAIDWASLFDREQPVEFEVGSGKGLFLANSAAARPDHNFLGVELSRKYARLSATLLCQRALANAKIWRGDARAVLARHVPDRGLAAIHVYFPDPWWKKRHKKRRVFTSALVTEIERTLQLGGVLKVASDVEEYFRLIEGLIHDRACLQVLPTPEITPALSPSDYLTNFERKYRIEGRPIFRAQYRKASVDSIG